jgi:flavin reductase (DIM6/NTAB) family NADH-FMN oxidoreductase RutF
MVKSLDPVNLSERDNYKFLIGSIIPRPIAFVTTLSEEGVLNGAPFSYFNIVSSRPPMVSISVQRRDGEPKDTAKNAVHEGAFVVHIVDTSYVEKINQAAASLPSNQSEVDTFGFTSVQSTKVRVPGIKEAKIRLECKLEKSIPLGDEQESCDLLIGRIVYYHIEDYLYENGRIDALKLNPVSRLAGNNYAKLGEIFSLDRPS